MPLPRSLIAEMAMDDRGPGMEGLLSVISHLFWGHRDMVSQGISQHTG
jgi:hypothetical protein